MNTLTAAELMLVGLRRLTDDVTKCAPTLSDDTNDIIAETSIVSLNGSVSYRGYCIEELAEHSTFLETASLLLRGELPDQESLADFRATITELSESDQVLTGWLQDVPVNADGMEVLRTGISMLAHFDPGRDDCNASETLLATQRLLAVVPLLISSRVRLQRGIDPPVSDPELGYAANLFQMLTGRAPSALQERAFDVLLMVQAGDCPAGPVLAGRMVSSHCCDVYSAVIAAVNSVARAGADRQTASLLKRIGRSARSDRPDRLVCDVLMHHRGLPGFRRANDQRPDVRVGVLTRFCRRLAAEAGMHALETAALQFERAARNEADHVPDLDWPALRLLHYCGVPAELYSPVLCMARIPAWAGHAIEQSRCAVAIGGRLRYVGPDRRRFVPISLRS